MVGCQLNYVKNNLHKAARCDIVRGISNILKMNHNNIRRDPETGELLYYTDRETGERINATNQHQQRQ